MPPLKSMSQDSLPGFVPAESAFRETPPVPSPKKTTGLNPFLRCPLPPFNAGPDTLRQFDESGKTPTRRVIPLPLQTNMGGNATVVQNTSVTTQSGGGSGGNVPVTVIAKTVTINAGIIPPNGVVIKSVTTSIIAVLISVGASAPCEVRIYGDSGTQSSDVPRVTDAAVPFEITPGVVTDVVLDTSPYQFNWENRLFVNHDSPQTTTMYVTVLNPSAGTVTPAVTITYLSVL